MNVEYITCYFRSGLLQQAKNRSEGGISLVYQGRGERVCSLLIYNVVKDPREVP